MSLITTCRDPVEDRRCWWCVLFALLMVRDVVCEET
jgi:hypothetical protein